MPFVALLVILGCAKQETPPSIPDHQMEEIISPNVYHFNIDENEINFEAVSLESLKSNSIATVTTRSNHPHSNGHFSAVDGAATFSYSVMQNNGGVHGHINMGGINWDMQLSSECIVVEGNNAVFAGQITDVTLIPSALEDQINSIPEFGGVIGTYIYLRVEDHGEGNNAPSDRFNNYYYISPEQFGPLCHLIPPNTSAWLPETVLDTDNESDQIQVSGD